MQSEHGNVTRPPAIEADFIPVAELAARTGYTKQSLYDAHSRGKGPLVEVLTKMGGRVGAWRLDYQAWIAKQRRLPDGRDTAA